MNTKNLKAYAPKARRQFIGAVKKRAAHLGIYQHNVEPVQFEGGAALIEGRVFSRKQGEQRQQLEKRVASKGYELFLREMAYTWFNRFAALRYMEIHEYLDHGFRVLSHPTNPDSLPEILSHASDVADSLELDKSHIIELQLAGDKEEELYRELLLGQCHHLHKIMPFMFEQLDDATELLLPDNLTKTDSILKDLVNDIPEEDWSQIEVIGWLYQFYISEHKDAVIGKVVKSEDIPAATQLFTPNWIVKYLVQNSVGRQWLATYPESELKGKMEYYIEPAEQTPEVVEQLKAITPTSIDPEQIKVLDPAAGSGHILVEVYEVLREIYLERGYRLREIPELILTKNIYGLDIDDRAAQLAGFALMMKAREDDRRIFQRVQDGDVHLNVYSMQSTEGLDIPRLWSALDLEDKHQKGTTGGLFEEPTGVIPAQAGIYNDYLQLLNYLKTSFLQAKTLGSLIQIDNQYLANLLALKDLLQVKQKSTDPAAKQAAIELLPIVYQAIALAQKYNAVVANPPFLDDKYFVYDLKECSKQNYKNYSQNLYSMFIQRTSELTDIGGEYCLVTPLTWMFISSYEKVRKNILLNHSISSSVKPSYTAFFEMASVQFVAFTIKKGVTNYKGSFFDLGYLGSAGDQPNRLKNKLENNLGSQCFSADFIKLPSSIIAFWLNDKMREAFLTGDLLGTFAKPRQGMATADNDRFVRFWFEIDHSKLGLNLESIEQAKELDKKWFPYNKGGGFKKWYGNNENVVNWENDGHEIRNFFVNGKLKSRPQNIEYFFKPSLTWSLISSYEFGVRVCEQGYLFDVGGSSAFPDEKDRYLVAGFMCSKLSSEFMQALNPSANMQVGNVANLPILKKDIEPDRTELENLVKSAIEISKVDYDNLEISYGFQKLPIFNYNSNRIKDNFNFELQTEAQDVSGLQYIEESINSLFIKAYGLVDSISSAVDNKYVTLYSNPDYKYSSKQGSDKNFIRHISDKAFDLVSYSIGCMMGRYSLDRKGLVYAHSGNEGFKELAAEDTYQTFPADDDGIIPLASEDWLFDDDATTRFREFVKIVWGAEHLNENLEFVAESLCLHALKPKKGEGAMDTIRRYFSSQFFKDHCKTYKKRPIYWLFSSGKEKAFECLVYLHRYNEGTLSRMRTEYVTPLMGKYEHQHSSLEQDILEGSTEQKRLAEKALKDLEKKQAELRTFDEQLKHHAEKRITLDLDDGVKVNYGKFGNLLADVKNIHGVAVK
ncbi:BREX-1 system adenine-specific DNA-methyltransferase PglX [Paraglaciecola sp. L1A13]|uniref:BREX-1 system adenine-specific DNA-methyltransferase PglX n=1 Tax=Paraglaciecola sp. L1A13 TaxID=2686359 RepID=UPI00131D395B|nr:BREX-1 system adenine-specific DNA-methyltransferase PglX [Paraglaciecola sp. L1A13]